MGFLDSIRRVFSGEKEEERTPVDYLGGGGTVVISNPEMVSLTSIPDPLIRRLWGLVEKDSAYTFLDDSEIRWLSFKVERIANIATMIEPEVWHPTIVKLLDQAIMNWVDKENASLLGYLRLKRSWRGMERRLSTVTAPYTAYAGE